MLNEDLRTDPSPDRGPAAPVYQHVSSTGMRLPAALSARSLLGQVTLMSDTMVVKALSGQRSLVGQRAELGYSFNASSGRLSLNDRSLSEWSREAAAGNGNSVNKTTPDVNQFYLKTHSFQRKKCSFV